MFSIASNLDAFRTTLEGLRDPLKEPGCSSATRCAALQSCLEAYTLVPRKAESTVFAFFDHVFAVDDKQDLFKTVLLFYGRLPIIKPYSGMAPVDLKILLSWLTYLRRFADEQTDPKLSVLQLELLSQVLFNAHNLGHGSGPAEFRRVAITKPVAELKLLQTPAKLLQLAVLAFNDKVADFGTGCVTYAQEILLSKAHKTMGDQLYCLQYFNAYFVKKSPKSAVEKLLPDLEKAILRSTEFVIGSILHDFLDAFIRSHDDVQFLVVSGNGFSKLFTQLVSNMKSSSSVVRDASAASLASLVTISDEQLSSKIVDELARLWKGTSNFEYKIGYVRLLRSLPVSDVVATKCEAALSLFVTKDQNEQLLAEFISLYLYWCFRTASLSDSALKTIKAGLLDKKLTTRKYWFINLADNVKEAAFVSSIESELERNTKEYLAAPAKCPPAIGCVLLYLGHRFLQKSDDALADVVTSSKLYLKVPEEDVPYFVDALLEAFGVGENFPMALTYTLTTANFHKKGRLHVLSRFVDTYKSANDEKKLQIVNYFADSLDELLPKLSSDEEVMKLNISLKLIKHALYSFASIPAEDATVQRTILAKVYVLAHYKQSETKLEWVNLALKSHQDPGLVMEEHTEELFKQLSKRLLSLDKSSGLSDVDAYYDAVVASIATAAFIRPDLVGPKILELVEVDLANSVSADDIEVWKTPEGTLAHDPLSKTQKYAENKNTKDYETKKWEELLNRELAKKKGVQKKLTKEEQEIVKKQLEVESNTRKTVQEIFLKVSRLVALISALSKALKNKISNGHNYWLQPAALALLNYLKSSSLLADSATSAYMSCGNILPYEPRFRKQIPALMLISAGVEIPLPNPESVRIDVLYSMSLFSEMMPLDEHCLTFVLPLLEYTISEKADILKKRGTVATTTEFAEADPDETAFLLAVSVVAHHAEVFARQVPREGILSALTTLLEQFDRKEVRDAFAALCANVSGVLSASEFKNIMIEPLVRLSAVVRRTLLEQLDEEFLLDYEELEAKDYAELWVNGYDEDEHIAGLANGVWEDSGLECDEALVSRTLDFVGVEHAGMRRLIARAVAGGVENVPQSFDGIFEQLISLFEEYSKPPEPIRDAFGLIIKTSEQQKDPWEAREGVALCLGTLAPFYTKEAALELFKRLIEENAFLDDKSPEVHSALQNSGVLVLKAHGRLLVGELVPMFESRVTRAQTKIKQLTVIFYGVLCEHLDKQKDHALILQVVDQLVKTLADPQTLELVAFTISKYIAPIVPLFEERLGEYFSVLFEVLFDGSLKISQRRGAAYGIAGLVKGCGIRALSEHDIIRNLTEAAEDKGDPKKRQSVAFAFECLSRMLGRYFEPYVLEIIPLLLKQLGDHVQDVRSAADKTAQVIMKNTTSFGVKKLIPLALEGLDEISWRLKKGSVELLGSMAYLDPTQLSASLLTIVPEIVGVLNDTHKEVRKAAEQAMQKFGHVIRNPEIQKLVPILIRAIGDPTHHTEAALDALIKTQFVHYIDGPSLALIVHVLHRGMMDRSAAMKRKSCQIVGNMAILVGSDDLIPYLPTLVSELEIAMVDPVAMTRATAARALGSLVEKLGENHFPGLISKLMGTLGDASKSGDRLGLAQALAEVLSGLGVSRMEDVLPALLAGAASNNLSVKKGYMPMLFYLPVCFGPQFAPYISRVIGPILSGLASEDDTVSDAAVRAGKLVVENYLGKAVELLLPELEKGLADPNHRIRLLSVRLVGDLLFKLGDISRKAVSVGEEEEEVVVGSGANARLVEVLGQETRDRVLATLFVCRLDTSGPVRTATIDIWNPIVGNTPRTLKEILPTLVGIIVRRLGSSYDEQRRISALALGDVVRRVGTAVLDQLLPTSSEMMVLGDVNAREGICVALSEIMASTSDANIVEHQDLFIQLVADAIIDSDLNVRAAAAHTFDGLLESIGGAAIDGVVPRLLALLEDNSQSNNALQALRELMQNKSDEIFPVLIPLLVRPPLDAAKASTLGALLEVAGNVLYRYLSGIMDVFLAALDGGCAQSEKEVVLKNFTRFLLSVDDSEGCHPLMQKVLSLLKNEAKSRRAVVYEHMATFFESTSLDYSVYTVDMLERCIGAFDDDDTAVVTLAWKCLDALIRHQLKDQLEKLVGPAEAALRAVGLPGLDLRAFAAVPKGPGCVLPIFNQGLMYGSATDKETAAIGIADVVSKTPAAGLRPFFTSITGPLIRVVGERVSPDVKAAILLALNVLLTKIPQFLRPFTPQLQRTFVRSLSDTSSELLRLRAAKGLGILIMYQPKIDPLVNELISGVSQNSDPGVQTAMMKALLEVVEKVGNKLGEEIKLSILELTEAEISGLDDKQAIACARLIGALSTTLKPEEAAQIIKDKILGGQNAKFAVLTLNAFLKDLPNTIFESGLVLAISNFLCNNIGGTDTYLAEQLIIAAGKLLLLIGETTAPQRFSTNKKVLEPFTLEPELVANVVELLAIASVKPKSGSLDARRLALVVFKTAARVKYEVVKNNLDIVVPCVFSCVRDVIIPVKLAAEKTFLVLLNLVQDETLETYTKWFEHVKTEVSTDGKSIKNAAGNPVILRALDEYTKRIGTRLAKVERERIEAGGDAEAMFSDHFEDEQEIWSVGTVDLSEV